MIPSSVPDSAEKCLAIYEQYLNRRGLVPQTIRGYCRDIKGLMRILEQHGRRTHPKYIKERDIEVILKDLRGRGIKPQTQKLYIHSLKGYLRYWDNSVIDRMNLIWPPAYSRTVDWLEPNQAQKLLDAATTPLQELVIHCELCLGMRRVEVLRLKLDSFREEEIMIQGKGRQGGQWRSLPYAPDTREVLSRWLSYRADLVENYQRYRPRTRIPEDLLIYTMYTGMKMMIGSYHSRGSGLDKAVIGPLRKATGLQFSNHTLRRTFARGLWMQGVPIETISTLLGHRTNEVTRRYIGVRHSDMASALTRLPYSGRVKDESKRC